MQHPLRRFKAERFKALSHPGRIKMLGALRAGEKTVGELHALLDDEPGSASQHLALLRTRDIVVGRKEGNNIFYSVRDPSLFRILDAAREIFSNQLVDSQEMLSYVREEEQAVGAGRPGAAENG